MRQQGAHSKREQDAHAAGSDCSRSLPVKLTVVQFHAHQEQEENQADCRKRLEWREGRNRKQACRKMWGKAAKDGWPDQDASDDFADHPRLPKLTSDPPATHGDY